MKKITSKIFSLIFSSTAKNTGIIFIGNAISSVLGIIFAIIAAFYLSPESWGVVASVRNLIIILIAVADLGLGAALFQYASKVWKENPKIAIEAYKKIFTLRIISCLLFCIVFLGFSGVLSKWAFGFVDNTLVYLSVLGFGGVLLLDFQVFAAQAKKSWKMASILIALTNIFRVILLLILVFLSRVNQYNVIFVFSISGLIAFILGLISLPYLPSLKFNINKVLQEFGHFSFWMSINKIVSTASSRIDVLFVLQILGAYKAGVYGIASTLAVGVPIIIGSFATILAAKFSAIEDLKELKNYFYKSIGLSVFISILLLVGVFVSPFVISFFGDKYKEATSILQWLFIGLIPFAFATPSVNILIYHFKKPSIIACLSILQLFIIVGINYFYLPTLDIFAPVWALGISNLTTMVITYIFAIKYLYEK